MEKSPRVVLTLFQRIAEDLAEDECWRLFLQIVDALVHMSSLGIVRLIDGNLPGLFD